MAGPAQFLETRILPQNLFLLENLSKQKKLKNQRSQQIRLNRAQVPIFKGMHFLGPRVYSSSLGSFARIYWVEGQQKRS